MWIESAIGQPNVPAPGCAQDATVRAELSAAQNLCDQVRTSSVACDIADLLFADEDASSGNATVCDERRQRKVSRQRPSKGPAPTIRKQQHVAPVVQWQTLPLGMIPTFSCQPWPVGVAAVSRPSPEVGCVCGRRGRAGPWRLARGLWRYVAPPIFEIFRVRRAGARRARRRRRAGPGGGMRRGPAAAGHCTQLTRDGHSLPKPSTP